MNDIEPSVGTLDRGLDILESFLREDATMTLSEVAEKVGLSPSTATRILSTLEKRGYMVRDAASKRYSLGPRARAMRERESALELLLIMADTPMRELQTTFPESISLFVPRGNGRVCIKRVESAYPLRQVVNVGDTLPLSLGAGGKVLCAWLETESIIDPSSLQPPVSPDQLATIRETGYASSFGEREAGTFAIAAPVFNASGKILATLALAGPVTRFDANKLPLMGEVVAHQASLISQSLGRV